jgi:hypothetical protein
MFAVELILAALATVVVISAGLVFAGLSTTSAGTQEKMDNKTIRIEEYPGSIVAFIIGCCWE